ncbi:MAG: hypothetical protein DRO12_04130 [Thermoprotei archaeon]|nr:MAG: hypothetical protein DRO12_04130 [Thermoprotei archaeon]
MELRAVGGVVHAVFIVLMSALMYSAAIFFMSSFLKRYRLPEEIKSLEKVGRKALISRKKRLIASIRQRKVRGRLTRVMIFQFFVPMAAFLAVALTSMLFAEAILSRSACLLPPPIQVESGELGCLTPTVWIILFVFFLFSPIYTAVFQRELASIDEHQA